MWDPECGVSSLQFEVRVRAQRALGWRLWNPSSDSGVTTSDSREVYNPCILGRRLRPWMSRIGTQLVA